MKEPGLGPPPPPNTHPSAGRGNGPAVNCACCPRTLGPVYPESAQQYKEIPRYPCDG